LELDPHGGWAETVGCQKEESAENPSFIVPDGHVLQFFCLLVSIFSLWN
jgi:hypothetical protein